MSKITALQLSEYILTNYSDKKITPMKLQKLVYYVKVWSLVAGLPKIDAPFYAWEYGPVNKKIYHAYKQFGSATIPTPPTSKAYEQQVTQQLNFILDNYVDYSAFLLSTMTHQEAPWAETEQGQQICEQTIMEFYIQQPFARNFGTDSDAPFYPVQGDSWHAFVMDMGEVDLVEFESFPSYALYRENKLQADTEFAALLRRQFNGIVQ